ncbi:MAG TPA: ZIP family metal transporter [Actinomycetota bacterium]|nr:ZIP family metal transporter [Actinomycetota bacterium]
MSTAQTIVLGAIAGSTIFLGLPLGRVRMASLRGRAFGNAVSAGILVFLLVDILAHATGPVEQAMEQAKDGEAAWGHFAGLGLVYVLGFGAGLVGLLYATRLWAPRRRTGSGQGPRTSIGPGAMAAAEAELAQPAAQAAALRVGMSIATGIGLHNFSEGLAIGQTAKSGAISLAALLIMGFALHNATEGFGIVGPLAAANVRASWGWLGLAGLIGGAPTFLGAVVGTSFDSVFVFVGCLALAAGAILYVLGEVLPVGRRLSWEVTLWGLLAGFVLGVATDLILVAVGG